MLLNIIEWKENVLIRILLICKIQKTHYIRTEICEPTMRWQTSLRWRINPVIVDDRIRWFKARLMVAEISPPHQRDRRELLLPPGLLGGNTHKVDPPHLLHISRSLLLRLRKLRVRNWTWVESNCWFQTIPRVVVNFTLYSQLYTKTRTLSLVSHFIFHKGFYVTCRLDCEIT